jgi:hypothetical protein
MPCPHLKLVVMLYCDQDPIRKMVPLHRIASAEPCLTEAFARCPILAGAAPPPDEPEPRPSEETEAHP